MLCAPSQRRQTAPRNLLLDDCRAGQCVKPLVDMNLSPYWIERLTAADPPRFIGHALPVSTRPDSEIMAYTAEHDYFVVTHDLDFSAILAAIQGANPSVVQVRAENLSPAIIRGQLIADIKQMTPELAAGALLTVTPSRARLHVRPLRLGRVYFRDLFCLQNL